MRYAMIDSDGTIASTVTANEAEVVQANTPPGCEAVECPPDVIVDLSRYDRATGRFVPA